MPTSQTQLLYDRVRQAILSFDLVPGSPLSERGLEAQYGASRTPVRAALMRLQAEGLAAREGRAWRVTPIDLDEVTALAEYREAVEIAAARLACARASNEEIAALAEADRVAQDSAGDAEALRGDLAALDGVLAVSVDRPDDLE